MADAALNFIGFGEAGQAFADGMTLPFGAYDRKILASATRSDARADCLRYGATPLAACADAVGSADLVLSLVTADEALIVAREAAGTIRPGTLFCDMNSVAPDTKRAAAAAIEAAGARYVDVAVMAPVHPQRRAVPLLLSGPHAEAGATALAAAGFTRIRCLTGGVGTASTVKMLRSVMVKGIEALTAECVAGAHRAGLSDEVFAALDASFPGFDWRARADYNLERMLVHGIRRADEMDEVVKTLDGLGTGSTMSRGTAARQRAIGGLGLSGEGPLEPKLAAIVPQTRDKAA